MPKYCIIIIIISLAFEKHMNQMLLQTVQNFVAFIKSAVNSHLISVLTPTTKVQNVIKKLCSITNSLF